MKSDSTKIHGLLSDLKISYTGLDADNHVMDAVQFGKSIEGTARLYNQAIYLFESGKLPNKKTIYSIKMYTGAPRQGSLFAAFHSLMATGQMAMYPPLWGKMANWFVPKMAQAVWQRLLNKPNETKLIIETMQEEANRNREFAKEMARMAINAVCKDKSRLLETVEKLAGHNKLAAISVVEPVGNSCTRLEHSLNKQKIITIDEASAEVIRSKEELEVTEIQRYKCKIDAVDKVAGSCKVILPNHPKPIFGKILDPKLQNLRNVYTNALDQGKEIVILAQTTIKDGIIQKFFISDAKHSDAKN